MRRVVCYIISLTIFWGISFSSDQGLSLIKTIGDERENHTFFRLSGAVLTPDNEIFVADSKGHFVAKYAWDGKFIKRIGQKGQGPGDFYMPGILNIFEKKLFIFDRGNYRVVISDTGLKQLEYKKFHSNKFLTGIMFVLESELYIGNSLSGDAENGRIKIVDFKTDKDISFFNTYPIKITKDANSKSIKNIMSAFLALPVFNLNEKKDKLLVTYQYPSNPVEFFMFSMDGKLLKKFDYKLDAKFKFPVHRLTYPVKHPDEFHQIIVDSVFYFQKHFIVSLVKLHYKKGKPAGTENSLLIFDSNGTLTATLPVESGLKVFYISKDGYLLAKNYDAEIEQLLIYRIRI
jgi:hypothetical protein